MVAVLTLALGIGVNTALFSVLRAVVLAPLPYPDSGSIVRVWHGRPVSGEIFEAIANGTDAFSTAAIHSGLTVTLEGEDGPRRLSAVEVSSQHFGVLGVEPALGRDFQAIDYQPGGEAVIISQRFWQRHFGGDAGALGSTLRLDGRQRTVVGVLPATHRALGTSWDVWLPLVFDRTSEAYDDWLSYRMIARLAPGVTPRKAQAECETALAPLRELHPERPELARPIPVVSLHEATVGDVSTMLWLLFAAVAVVLLIACTNVANLMLARLGGRRRELALRIALGASRSRLVTQLVGESLVLAVIGGLLGLLVAAWTLGGLSAALTAELPRADSIAIDSGVLGFNLVATLIAGLLFGLLPAWRASRRDFGADLTNVANRGGSPTFGTLRLGALLVAGEVALAVLLVSGAGLLLKSFWCLERVDPGFESAGIQTLTLEPAVLRYGDAERSQFFARVEEHLAALPAVESVGAINLLPLTSGNVVVTYRHPDMAADEAARPVTVRIVTPGYFATIGAHPIAGRLIEPGDRAGSEEVGLVNEAMARVLLADAPQREVVGRAVQGSDGAPWLTVVGVVPDQRQSELDRAPEPTVFRPLSQETWDTQMVYVMRSGAAIPSQAMIAQAVAAVDPGVPVPSLVSFESVVQRSLGEDRRLTTFFAIFAGLALVLGGLGVYGVTAHAVSQRRHEHGVRLALGARGHEVVRGALLRALRPVVAGLVVGLPMAVLSSSLLAEWLYQVEVTDPWVHGAVVLFLGGCAALASYLPARRCARVDPMSILGSD